MGNQYNEPSTLQTSYNHSKSASSISPTQSSPTHSSPPHSLLEIEQKSELRRLLSSTPQPQPQHSNSSTDDTQEKTRLALLLYRAQLERRQLVREVVANLSVAGMSEKQGVYKGLIAKALGEREEDVESMLPEILRELEEARTAECAEGLEGLGSPL